MPRVPVIQQNQVQEAGIPNVRRQATARPEDYGAGIGQALGNAGQTVIGIERQREQVYQQERLKAQRIAVDDAANKLGAWEANAMPAAMQVKGKDAFALPQQVLTDYDKTTQKIEDGLADPDQKEMFRLLAADRRNGVTRVLQTHLGDERQAYDDQVFKGTLGLSQQAIGIYYDDDLRVNDELDRQAVAIEDYGTRNGLPPEWIQETKAKAISQSHRTVIGQYVDSEDDQGAKRHLEQYRVELTAEDLSSVRNAVESASLRGESQRQAAGIFSTSKPLDQMLDEARAIKDPKMQDETMRRIKDLHVSYEKAKDEQETQAYSQGYDIIASPDNRRGFDAIPESLKARMTPESKERLLTIASNRLRRIDPVTDGATWQSLDADAVSKPTAFAAMNLDEFADRISHSDLMALRKRQNAIKLGGDSDLKTPEKHLSNALEQTPGYIKLSKEDQAQFKLALRKSVAASEEGKPLGWEQVQKITDSLLLERVAKPGAIWDTKVPTFKLPQLQEILAPSTGPLAPDEAANVGKIFADPSADGHQELLDALVMQSTGKNSLGEADPTVTDRWKQVVESSGVPASELEAMESVIRNARKRDPLPDEMIQAASEWHKLKREEQVQKNLDATAQYRFPDLF